MCDKKTSQQVNDESGLLHWWPKIVTQETVWSNQVSTVLANDIWGGNKGTLGKLHDYLGMDLEFSEIGVVKMSTIKYSQKVLDELTEEFRVASVPPPADHLLHIRGFKEADFLQEDWV